MRNFSLALLLATSVCSPALAQSASDEARTSREEARAERAEQRAEQAQAAPVQVERAQAAPVFEQRAAEIERIRIPEVRSEPQIEVAQRGDDRGQRGDDGEGRGRRGRDATIAAQAQQVQQQQPQTQFGNRNFQGHPDGGFQVRRDESSQTRDDGRFNRGGGQGVFQGTPPLAQNDRRGWGGRSWDGNHNGEHHDDHLDGQIGEHHGDEHHDGHHDEHHDDHHDNHGWNQGNTGQIQVWNRGGDGRWNRGHDGQWNRHDGDHDHNWNNGQRWGDNHNWNNNQRWGDNRNWNNNQGWNRNNNRWDRGWRNDNRYNWQTYRYQYRDRYHQGRYYNPYGYDYSYQRFGIGIYLDSLFFGSRYWLDDPSSYRLPRAPYGYRWVRYYNDVILVDTRTGYVEDVIHDFFW